MKQIYLCGPITGRPAYEHHFFRVEKEIYDKAKAQGLPISILNPARFPVKKEAWESCLRYSIRELLTCDGVALLQGWQHSRGCSMELSLAGQLKIPVVYLEPPVNVSVISLFRELPVYSDIPRYFEKRLVQMEAEGRDENAMEDRAFLETCNRFLDPHGFEYIDRD